MIESEKMRVLPSEVEASRRSILDFIAGFFDSAPLRMTLD